MRRSILGWILVAGLSVVLSGALVVAQTKTTQKTSETKAGAKKETGAAEKTKAPAEKKETAPAAKKETGPASKKEVVLVDINSASKQELMTLQGIGEELSQKIIQGRPYKMKTQLKSRKIIPDATYEKIAAKIIAKQAAKPAKK